MPNWYSLIDDKADYQIEFAFGDGLNLRVKIKGEEFWKYAEAENIDDALIIGEQLLKRGEGEQTYSLLDYTYFDLGGVE